MKQTFTRISHFALGIVLSLLFSVPASAQTPMYFTATGGSNNVFPLASTTNMVQWVFLPTDFNTTIPSNSFITTIYLRPPTGYTITSTTFTNFQVKMGSTTASAMAGGTWISGLNTVINSASYVMSPPLVTAGWIAFNLTTPFYYNGGNFYLEISQTGYVGSGLTIAQDASANRRQWGTVGSSSASSFGSGLVTLGVDVIPADCSGQPTNPTIATPAFNPAAPLCIGSTTSITGVNPNLGSGLSVFWQTSSSASGPWTAVSGGSGATTLTYTTPAITANTYFRMGVNCSFSGLNAYSPAFLVPVGAPQPGVINGSSTFCPGDASTYTVANVPGTTYTWTLPTGWTSVLAAPPATNSIIVTPNTTAGSVSVIGTSSCGTSIAQTRAIVAGSAPAPPASVNGNAYICANTPQTYTVAPVAGATGYVWTLPTGWIGTSTTNTINATNASTSGNVTVRAVNGCGQSLATVLPISVISSLPNPGTITGKDTLCSGALQTYSITPVNGATSYVWTLPPGWSGTTTGTSIQVFGGTSTGPISVTAYVSCATSPTSSRTLTAVTTVTPTVTLSSPSGPLCERKPITFTATTTGGGTNPTYIWRKNGTVVTGTGNTYTTASLSNGDVIAVTLNSNAACASSPTVVATPVTAQIIPAVVPGISINTLPTTSICRGTSLALSATATGGGSGPVYQWFKNGQPISGANSLSYVANGLSDQDTLTVSIASNAVCATQTVSNSNQVIVNVADVLVPGVDISVSPSNILFVGQPVTFTATPTNGGPTPGYQWMLNGDNIPFETNPTFTSSTLLPNDYVTVRMVSYLSCASPKTAKSAPIVMRADPLSVGSTPTGDGFRLYPNPTSGMLSVRGTAAVRGGLRLEVMNAVGQMVHRVELPGGGASANWTHDLELPSGLAAGQYMLRISNETGGARQTLATLPFILQR
jgi:hypothetical protein